MEWPAIPSGQRAISHFSALLEVCPLPGPPNSECSRKVCASSRLQWSLAPHRAYPSWRFNWKFLERVQQGRTFCRLAFSSPCISRNLLSILEIALSKDRARRGLASLAASAAKGKNLYTRSRFRCAIARSGGAYRKTLYRKELLPGKMIRTRRMFTVSVIAS